MAAQLAVGGGGVVVGGLGVAKPTSRTSSFEIENLLKTAEQVSAVPENRWDNQEEEQEDGDLLKPGNWETGNGGNQTQTQLSRPPMTPSTAPHNPTPFSMYIFTTPLLRPTGTCHLEGKSNCFELAKRKRKLLKRAPNTTFSCGWAKGMGCSSSLVL